MVSVVADGCGVHASIYLWAAWTDGLKQYRCSRCYLAVSDDAGVTCSLMQNSDQTCHAKQCLPASTQAVLPSNV